MARREYVLCQDSCAAVPRHILTAGHLQADGICVTKTKQAILIGEYVEGTTAVDANGVVEGMAKYLSDQGF